MKLFLKLLLTLPGALLLATTVRAQPFVTNDPRAMAMAGTVVAVAKPDLAALYNPALLSWPAPGIDHTTDHTTDHTKAKAGRGLYLVLPALGLGYYADYDAVQSYNDFDDDNYLSSVQDSVSDLNNAVANNDDVAFANARQRLLRDTYNLTDSLYDLTEQPFRVDGGAFVGIARPRPQLGLAAYGNVSATMEVAPLISACDNQLLDDYLSFFAAVSSTAELQAAAQDPDLNQAGCSGNPIVDAGSGTIINPTDDLSSDIVVAGVALNEVGIALSRELELFGTRFALGVTPKVQTVISYYTVVTIQQADDSNYDLQEELRASRNREHSANLDLALAADLVPDRLTLGLVARNLVRQVHKTKTDVNGDYVEFAVEPQLRAGLAWHMPVGLTLAADLDLTENQPYFIGDSTRFLSAGVEWDAVSVARMLQLRCGISANLANTQEFYFSTGLGFHFGATQIDLGGRFGENNAGVALQLGLEL